MHTCCHSIAVAVMNTFASHVLPPDNVNLPLQRSEPRMSQLVTHKPLVSYCKAIETSKVTVHGMISQTQINLGIVIAVTTWTIIWKSSHLKPQAKLEDEAKLIIGQCETGLRGCDKKPIPRMTLRVFTGTKSNPVNLSGSLLVEIHSLVELTGGIS